MRISPGNGEFQISVWISPKPSGLIVTCSWLLELKSADILELVLILAGIYISLWMESESCFRMGFLLIPCMLFLLINVDVHMLTKPLDSKHPTSNGISLSGRHMVVGWVFFNNFYFTKWTSIVFLISIKYMNSLLYSEFLSRDHCDDEYDDDNDDDFPIT